MPKRTRIQQRNILIHLAQCDTEELYVSRNWFYFGVFSITTCKIQTTACVSEQHQRTVGEAQSTRILFEMQGIQHYSVIGTLTAFGLEIQRAAIYFKNLRCSSRSDKL